MQNVPCKWANSRQRLNSLYFWQDRGSRGATGRPTEQRKVLPVCRYVSRRRPEGSTEPFKGRKVSWEFLTYFGDKLRQTEKGLKNTNSGQSRDSLKTQRLSSLCSYLWCWVGFHPRFLFFPSSLKNATSSIGFLTGPAWQKQPTLPRRSPCSGRGSQAGHPERQGSPAALQRPRHSTQLSRLGLFHSNHPKFCRVSEDKLHSCRSCRWSAAGA